jgi:branched-chain amino acid transport system ATP-binding protein
MTALIEVRGLTKRFGGFVALSNINFDVAEGERLGMIGPNGSGKTTLMSCIVGSHRQTTGSIKFDNIEISSLPANQRTRRGLARSYQIPRPFSSMTVLENILVSLDYGYREANKTTRALDLLKEFGLGAKADVLSRELNQIELRRLELARATATRPRALISDESMAGLSHSEVDEVLNILFRLSNQGITIIMIEHIMRAVMRFSQRLICLDAGKIIAEGSPETIVESPEVRSAYFGTSTKRRSARLVMRGFDPRIHLEKTSRRKKMDCRVEPGNDDVNGFPPTAVGISLTIEKLNAGYGAVRVLNDVSLKVNDGETVVLLGTSGNGKSTLLKTIAGIIAPTSGRILLTRNGQTVDLANKSPQDIVANGVSLIPEGRQLFPMLTVEENLMLGAFRDHARKRLKRNLDFSYEAFPVLRERRRQLVGSMSGGQQQMVAIAMAMMAEPSLLLVDEPSVGLAPLLVTQMIDRIGELKDTRGLTVLMAEQNYHEAARIADRGYVIVQGSIVFAGASVLELEQNNIVQTLYMGA